MISGGIEVNSLTETMHSLIKDIFMTLSNIYKGVFCLTLSWRRSLSYRNQSVDLHSKSVDWFLYDRELCHEN